MLLFSAHSCFDNLNLSTTGPVSVGVTEAAGESDNLRVSTMTYGKIVKDEIVRLHRDSRLQGKYLLVIDGG